MDGGELHNVRKFPVWIIEHVWAHKMVEIQEVLAPSSWPDVDSQPLSLEDSWRLRVASAQVYSIVKRRNMELFERAMSFLEATHRLLPSLVSAIKHMKIMFGLKTMVIMWMLRERRGMIDTVSKICDFFPNKLPQYQNQCSQHEMFLMRKNHLDFKSLAQSLALDRHRLEDYIQNQMEQQYGERYAQKVEERLLHYLHQLEAALPRETYIDKVLRKQSPVTEEEKLLLEVITSDSTTITATLRRLLHCDDASCRPAESSEHPESAGSLTEKQEASGQSVDDAASSPQFCSKHQRWVESILRECPDESADELLLKAGVSSSPPLFQSSSSGSSSQDLTPSDLVPHPPDHRTPSQTSTPPQTAVRDEDKLSSPEAPPPPSRNTPPPALLSPVVQLADIASSRSYAAFKPHLENPATMSTSPPDSQPVPPAAVCQQAASSVRLHLKPVSKLSLRFRRAPPAAAPSSSSQLSRPTHSSSSSSSRASPAPPSVRAETSTAPLRLSLPSVSVLLRSKLLQPYVSLTRLSAEESVPTGPSAEQEDTDSSFDVNSLYSSGSSGSSDEDSQSDPDYKPHLKKKRLLLEYENARMVTE